MKDCLHKNIEFLGIQHTLHRNSPLYLFICKVCHTAIAINKPDMIHIVLSIPDDDILRLLR
ncbi:hypothetical protein ES705_25647 [subsurface metagenome]